MKSVCPFQSYDKKSPLVYNQNAATWEKRGKDNCCSYCGSWHPQEFLQFLKAVTENPSEKIRIELNDRRDKIYVNRFGVDNAKNGVIKVYLIHIKRYCEDVGFDIDEIDKQLHEAFKVSRVKAKVHADKIMEELRKGSFN